MKTYLLASCALLLVLFSCKKDDSENNNQANIEKFLGNYEIENIHISGIHTFYDSTGNITFQGNDTTTVSNDLFSITMGNDNDTLLINSLINNLNNSSTEVKGVVTGDTLKIVHDHSFAPTFNNFIKGNIWMKEDSIFLNYYWDKSDTWSAGALPVRGEVEGQVCVGESPRVLR